MRLAGDRETSRACWPCQLDSSKQMFNPINPSFFNSTESVTRISNGDRHYVLEPPADYLW